MATDPSIGVQCHSCGRRNKADAAFCTGCGASLTAGRPAERAVQHETDHLNGILFIDRMTRVEKEKIKPEIDELQAQTKTALKK